jgi:CotH kinase protein
MKIQHIINRCWLVLLGFCTFSAPIAAQDIYGSGVQEVRLEINDSRWEARLDSIKRNNPEARIPATVYVNGARYDSVGVRFKGNSSYFRTRKETLRKLPFNMKVDFRKKGQKLPGGYSSLKLSNAFLDPTFVREPLSYEIVRKYMPAPQCNFVRLSINNKPYGLYVNSESIDLNFLRKHYGYTGGHIVKCDPDQWTKVRSQSGCPKGENASLTYLNDSPGCYSAFYEVDDPAAWDDLIRMIRILNKKPAEIESVLNVDQALWMLALNNAMVNLDSYNGSLSHNYYLWFDSTGVGHPLIWDLNMSFGGWRRNNSFEEIPDAQLIQYQPLAEMDNARRPLISQLFKNSLYRKIYLAHLRTITNDWFKSGQLNARATALVNDIDYWVKQDTIKLYSYEQFKANMTQSVKTGPDNIVGLRLLMDKRTEYLAAHPLLNKPQPTFSEARHTPNGTQIVLSVRLTDASKGGHAYYRRDRMFAFTRTPLYDDGTHGDTTAGDGVFSVEVEAAKVRHYYFAAENEDAAATWPERASYEFLEVR